MFKVSNEVVEDFGSTEGSFRVPYLVIDAIKALKVDFPEADVVRFSFTESNTVFKVFERGEEALLMKFKGYNPKRRHFDFTPETLEQIIDGLRLMRFVVIPEGYYLETVRHNERCTQQLETA